jgi:hypothetical protein
VLTLRRLVWPCMETPMCVNSLQCEICLLWARYKGWSDVIGLRITVFQDLSKLSMLGLKIEA